MTDLLSLDVFSKASTWAAIASATAAWAALALSLLGVSTSRRALRLAERQEERRRPVLVPYLVDGYVLFRKSEQDRAYAFLLSLSNPSDTPNGISGVDLHVTYTTAKGHQMTVKVRADSNLASVFADATVPILQIPARAEAHETISGWIFFRMDEGVLEGAAVDGYSIVLTDSQGNHVTLEQTIVRELGDGIKVASHEDLA